MATQHSFPLAHFIASDVRVRGLSAPDCGYRVAWQINPHMVPGSTELDVAERQHAAFVRALRRAGARVDIVPFVRGCYDSVFAKDCALALDDARGRRALLAKPRHPQRSAEQLARRGHLRARGFDVVHAPHHVEGGDIVRMPGGWLVGHGFRTDPRAASTLREITGEPVLPLELIDAHLYHLDTALAALDDGTVLCCLEALSDASRAALLRCPFVRAVVGVPRVDALRFGLNMVQVGKRVVLGGRAPSVERCLERRGLAPVVVSLSQFHRAGGSAACLVARVHGAEAARDALRDRGAC